ncbi:MULTISPECIES: cold-shock protein [unclassified Streptosporangium]|uniref:cold-shock protein n=1 Tax=unclassified Streptosporangium TaxID=2632669 RepID=UPI002E2DDFAB|nr:MULTISPECIES: cold shock domain-containing protein [unclassified Streptosporangium]
MAVGTILRFDEVRGYGFIAAVGGGEDVFFHANDFGESRHVVQPGMRVEYEVMEGERGLKVSTVSLLDPPPARRPVTAVAPTATVSSQQLGDDDGVCDVLSAKSFSGAVTELLIEHAPTLTGAQIGQVRHRFLAFARSHGWVDD